MWTHPVLCSDSRRSSGDAFLPSVSGSRRQSGGTAEEMRLGFIRQATARGVRPNMVSRVELLYIVELDTKKYILELNTEKGTRGTVLTDVKPR